MDTRIGINPTKQGGEKLAFPATSSRRNFLKASASLVAGSASVNSSLSASDIEWNSDNLSRRELRDLGKSDVVRFRRISPMAGLRGFGSSTKIFQVNDIIAARLGLESGYENRRYALIGAAQYTPSDKRDKKFDQWTSDNSDKRWIGAITIMDIDSKEIVKITPCPNPTDEHGLGIGIKLSPSGRHAAYETAGGFLVIEDLYTGELKTLEHPRFGVYALNHQTGEFERDVKRRTNDEDRGCNAVFLDDNTLIVSGRWDNYVAPNGQTGHQGFSRITFEAFDVNGNHLKSISDYESRNYSASGSLCFGISGANLIHRDGFLYYASQDMRDPGFASTTTSDTPREYWTQNRGRVGAFDLRGEPNDLMISVLKPEEARDPSFFLKGSFGRAFELVGSYLVTNRHPERRNERASSGGVLVFSLNNGVPEVKAEIEVGKALNSRIFVNSFVPISEDKVVFDMGTPATRREGPKTRLAVLDVNTLDFKVLEGFELAAIGGVVLSRDPSDPTRIIVGNPARSVIWEVQYKLRSLGLDPHYTGSGFE